MTIKTFGDLARHLTENGNPTVRLASSHAKLIRGIVWCRSCGSSRNVESAQAMRGGAGWPTCCGQTMTIDSPEEQQ